MSNSLRKLSLITALTATTACNAPANITTSNDHNPDAGSEVIKDERKNIRTDAGTITAIAETDSGSEETRTPPSTPDARSDTMINENPLNENEVDAGNNTPINDFPIRQAEDAGSQMDTDPQEFPPEVPEDTEVEEYADAGIKINPVPAPTDMESTPDVSSEPCTHTVTASGIHYNCAGGTTDYNVGVGDKIAIGDGINVRIDAITPYARYSIWGKDTNDRCKLLSSNGWFWLGEENDFREFTDSFLEAVSRDQDRIQLKLHYGKAARERCEDMAGWKEPIACSFYPTDDHYYIQNGSFRTYFFGEEAHPAAEYYAQAFDNCYQQFVSQIPELSAVQPIGRTHWDVYSNLEATGAYSADYQRISIPKNKFDAPPEEIDLKMSWIENGTCPAEESAIAHELTHILFSRTFLQDVYDGGSKTEWVNYAIPQPGSMTVTEGFAQFMAHYILRDSTNEIAQQSREIWESLCGKDHLIDTGSNIAEFYGVTDATEEQRQYSNITMFGGGYGFNHYPAGYCFYKRIIDDCGDASFRDLLSKAIQYDGSMASHPTMFRYLADSCGEETVTEIMGDFGFDQALLDMTQRWPNQDFPNGLQEEGCL